MDALCIDLKQLLEEKLIKASQDTPLIAVYLQDRNTVLGALAQLLQINLADILLGKASIQHTDVLVLSFSDTQEAKQLFEKIPEYWDIKDTREHIHAQFWNQGRLEAENTYAELQTFQPGERHQGTIE